MPPSLPPAPDTSMDTRRHSQSPQRPYGSDGAGPAAGRAEAPAPASTLAARKPLTPPSAQHPSVGNQPDAHAPVEIDEEYDRPWDTDSAVGSDGDMSNTGSLNSSIFNYQYENGRTYHSFRDGTYIMPNDDREQERLDLVHHVWRLILRGELYRAPLSPNMQRVLDIGTGTGIWAMEFADEFPSVSVIANDLSPIQPGWVPPNIQFEIDDAEDDWTYKQPFDYIHIRNMGASIADWQRLCSQAMQHLKPGGWIEIQEHAIQMHSEDGEVPPNMADWLEKMEDAARSFGKEMNIAKEVKGYLEIAGFEDVREDIYKIPIGTWAKDKRMKEIGMYQQAAFLDSIEPYSLALFSRVLNWDLPRLQVYLAAVRGEARESNNHLFCRTYIVYSQKPFT